MINFPDRGSDPGDALNSDPHNAGSSAHTLADRLDTLFPPGDGEAVPPLDSDARIWAAWQIARGPHPALANHTTDRIEARLRTAARLRHAHHPALDDRSVARIEARILPSTKRRFMRKKRIAWISPLGRIAAALVIVPIMIVALFGTATASAHSLPGETLYPVKRWVESGQLALASDAQALDLRLHFAERRLDEFEQLLGRGDLVPDTLDAAIADIESALQLVQSGAGSADGIADRVLALTARHVALADRAGVQALEDNARLARLVQSVTDANALSRRTHAIIASTNAPLEAFTTPRILNNLAVPGTSLYIPQDLPELRPQTTTLDAGSTGLYLPGSPERIIPAGTGTGSTPYRSPSLPVR